MQPDTNKESAVSELQDELVTQEKSIEIKHVHLFQNLLFGVSIVLILGTAIFALDLILSVVLGCLVIGFNFVASNIIFRMKILVHFSGQFQYQTAYV